MDSLDKIFDRFPALVSGLDDERWDETFDHKSLKQGEKMASGSRMKTLRIKEDSPGIGAIMVDLKGATAIPFKTEIRFETRDDTMDLDPVSCSCKTGYGCEHLAAVVTFLTKRANQYRSAGVKRAPVFDWQTEDWLKRMETIAVHNEASVTEKVKPHNKILAFCIEKNAFRDDVTMNLRIGTVKKSGEVSLERALASADVSRPPKYLSDEDIPLIIRYRNLQRLHYDYQGLKLEGKACGQFVEDVLATGRLFIVKSIESSISMSSEKAVKGPVQKVKATWERMEGKRSRPVLEFSREGLSFMPTDPCFYIDFQTGDFGKLKSDLPGNLLKMWKTGPIIQEQVTDAVGEKLRTIPGSRMPLPVKLEEKLMPDVKPRGILKIWRTDIGGRLVILADPFFQYEKSSLMPPSGAGYPEMTHADIRGDICYVWSRNHAAESELIERLEGGGFEHVTGHFSSEDLEEKTRHAFLRNGTASDDVEAWLAYLAGDEAAELDGLGWEIQVDPRSGLVLRDVSDFFPEIESDPDHGIDWFRFDVTGEVDGKRFSLVPHIATAIRQGILENLPEAEEKGEFTLIQCEKPEDGYVRFPTERFLKICQQVGHLFQAERPDGPLRLDRLGAADIADSLDINSSETTRNLARLARNLRSIGKMEPKALPEGIDAHLRAYQVEGFRWLQFLGENGLHGVLADDMGLGKTLQTLTHLCAEVAKKPGRPSLVIAPTSVVPNWASEAERFTPGLRVVTFHGSGRASLHDQIPDADIVLTSYPLLARDIDILGKQEWQVVVLDEAQYIKNPKAAVARNACKLKAAQRICLSGTPMENHLGELWSLMRFLMPGFLGDEKTFNKQLRRPIERERSGDAQKALNRRVSPLILRRKKDEVAKELPEKTEIIHHIDLTKKQTDLYESVRAAMDKRVRDAISEKGFAKSHIIVLDALLKLRQICCHPLLLNLPEAEETPESAKLDFLATELLPTLLDEGRRILLFSQFTSMLALIEAHLEKENIPFLKLTGQTKDRASLVKRFQADEVPIFLISLKAGGTGLNLTAADTVIHYDPWWNPASENQATDRAHRIGQKKPVFVHKLACSGTIEDRILELQKHKSALVEALLSEETAKLKMDAETLSHLLAPLD